jgi:hypothetical protein
MSLVVDVIDHMYRLNGLLYDKVIVFHCWLCCSCLLLERCRLATLPCLSKPL